MEKCFAERLGLLWASPSGESVAVVCGVESGPSWVSRCVARDEVNVSVGM